MRSARTFSSTIAGCLEPSKGRGVCNLKKVPLGFRAARRREQVKKGSIQSFSQELRATVEKKYSIALSCQVTTRSGPGHVVRRVIRVSDPRK